MYRKRTLLLVVTLIALISTAVIHNVSAEIDNTDTVAASPPAPPCLTTELCFENAVQATNFSSAQDLAVGYLNNGDNLDFVTTGWSRDRIRIKTGLGDGTFWGTWTKNMGDGTHEVDIADFNGDGHTDIIANNSEKDRVFIRWGHNGWTGSSVWATDDYPHYIATGDLNNDGLDDFATGNTKLNNESITVRLRQAGGGFAAATHYPVSQDLADVAFNDCDHDGDLDMFYSAFLEDFSFPYEPEAFVYLRLNEGNGFFPVAVPIDMDSEGYDNYLETIAFGDLNEDGWDDIVATRSDQKLVRVLGGANCSFHSPIAADVQINPKRLAIADMNGDGHLDVVLSHLFPQLITIYLGQGNGNMSGPYAPDLKGLGDVHDVGVGDFNDDGLMDIVYAEDFGGVWLLLARESDAPPWELPWLVVNEMGFALAGQSQLDWINDRIILSNIGATGDDGVDVLLDNAKLWTADIEIEGHVGAQMHLDTIADETSASSLQLISTQIGMEVRPSFASTNYLIEYRHGAEIELALIWAGTAGGAAATVNWDEVWCLMNSPGVPSELCHIIYQTGIYADGDDIDIWIPQPIEMTAANGNRVTADHIRMVEIPDGQAAQGAGPETENGFSRIEIRGADVDSLTLSNVSMESAEPPLPDPPATSYNLYLPMIER